MTKNQLRFYLILFAIESFQNDLRLNELLGKQVQYVLISHENVLPWTPQEGITIVLILKEVFYLIHSVLNFFVLT